jgi:hypothetical protein
MRWARLAQEKDRRGPPSCSSSGRNRPTDAASDRGNADASHGGSTWGRGEDEADAGEVEAVAGMNCPRTAGGETRRGGTGPRHVPARVFFGTGKHREDGVALAAATCLSASCLDLP